MTDWATVAVGATTAAAAIGGVWMQSRAAERRAAEEGRHRAWVERRDAYMDLLAQIERTRAAADGASVTGLPATSGDYAPAFLAARVKAEFYAPPAVWAQMRPLVEAAALRMNLVSGTRRPEVLAELAERLRALTGNDADGWERLWQQYLSAARSDLGLS